MTTVWYRRPEGSGTKLDGRWCGPALVVGKEGEYSYLVEVAPGEVKRIHRSFLKVHIADRFSGTPLERFFHRRTVIDEEAQPDEWEVEKIMGHRLGPDKNGDFWYTGRGALRRTPSGSLSEISYIGTVLPWWIIVNVIILKST